MENLDNYLKEKPETSDFEVIFNEAKKNNLL